jgi:hypothetical protein
MAIRDAFVAKLQQAPAISGGRIVGNRRRPMAAQDASQVFVYLEESIAAQGAILGAPIDWQTRLRIECVARETSGATAEELADSLAQEVFARIQSDINLAGLTQDIEPTALAWMEDEGDTSVMSAQLLFNAVHRTQNNTIAG